MAKKLLLIVTLSFMLICMFASCDLINSHTHSFGEWETTKAATCTESGSKERYCECGEKQTQTIYATGHQYDEWVITKEPTCTEIGSKERYCECGEKQTQNISATGHQYGEWVVAKEAACIVDGLKEKVCVACQCKETETISANGRHNYVDGVCSGCNKEANCIKLTNIQSTITLPDVPREVSNSVAKVKLTTLTWTVDSSYIYITFSGEKTWCYYGGSRYVDFTFKIYDSEGYLIDDRSTTVWELSVGDKFKDVTVKIPLSSLEANNDYTVKIIIHC